MTLTSPAEAVNEVEALTFLAVVVAPARTSISNVLPTFTVILLGTVNFTRATSPVPVVGCWTALPVRLTVALPPLLVILIVDPVSAPAIVGV